MTTQVRGGIPSIARQPALLRRQGATRYARYVKPTIDRIGGVVLTVMSLPLVILIAAAVRATMGPGVLFIQERVGRDGATFRLYKFRTMDQDRRRRDAGPIDGVERRVNHKSGDDPRHTPVGRFLRKWSLDEIPQFWNVALGHMSLVGPRPELPSIVATYEPWQHHRHVVKPGITGLWQISERGDRPLHEATELDLEYVRDLSFRTDLKILLATPAAALGRRKGA